MFCKINIFTVSGVMTATCLWSCVLVEVDRSDSLLQFSDLLSQGIDRIFHQEGPIDAGRT
jgi:hypothetical protein